MKLKGSIEEILKEEQHQEWTLGGAQVPQQTEKESCGYRMLYNLNRLCNQENTETIEDEEMARSGRLYIGDSQDIEKKTARHCPKKIRTRRGKAL